MKINSEIRAAAREELRGNWGSPVLATLILFVISGIAQGLSNTTFYDYSTGSFTLPPMFWTRTSIGFLLEIFVILPLSFGFSIAFLRFIRGEKDDVINSMFGEFKNYSRALVVPLLTAVFTFLWALLFIIPGIIKGYSYAMSYFIAKDHPELDANGCIEESMKMMDGHKMDLFLLDLSFIGWGFLCLFTCGIGFLWLVPYMQTSHAIFYKELKAELYPEMEDVEATVMEESNGMEFTAEFEN